MAKKIVAAPVAAALEAKAKKNAESRLRVKGKLEYFWDTAELSWDYCRQHQARIVVFAPYLTLAYIELQVASITASRALPNNEVRSAGNTRALKGVTSRRREVVAKANLLEASLRKFYESNPADYEVERKAAGLPSFREASAANYSAVSTFITTASNYLDTYGQALVDALAMPATFTQEFKDLGELFNLAKKGLNNARETAKMGTGTVVSKVDDIKLQISRMQAFGKEAFKDEPDIYRFFTEEYILDTVRTSHPASLNGRTTWPKEEGMDKAKPVAGLKVEVLDDEVKSAVTNKIGRYEIKQLSAGEHRVRISGTGIQPVELLVTLEPGKSLRQNVTVEVPPVVIEPEATATKEATPPPASVNEAFFNAMKEVTEAPTNGAMVH